MKEHENKAIEASRSNELLDGAVDYYEPPAAWDYSTEDEEYEAARAEYYATHHTCEICAGEFWDGGCSCTCEDESIEEFARQHWLERIELALWRAHKDVLERLGLDTYEEVQAYEALCFFIHHRNAIAV